jgi:lipopolysaccharide biosynthesis glycosyltransferase
MSEETRGVILFNRGEKCLCRAIVTLYSLRQHWDGPVTFFLEDPYPKEFDDVCRHFNVDIQYVSNPDSKALVRSAEVCLDTPYDRTMWLDSDTVVVGKIDEMFEYLDDYEVAIPHFAGWWSTGRKISGRIKRYEGIADKSCLDKALEKNPAVNTGIISFKKNAKFLHDWIALAQKGGKATPKMFIPDEVAFQVMYPSYPEVLIAPTKFNVSVLHDPDTEDRRIMHYHGQKHVLNNPNCDIWKEMFKEMCDQNIANINHFVKEYADKRLKKYLDSGQPRKDGVVNDVTIVTACDEFYVDILRETFPNWQKYKKIDEYPVIVFVHGIPLDDDRLEFLRLPNVTLVPWSMDNVDNHREEMLSAFVFGAAENVKTDFWMKLDADSYATDARPLITEDMKKYDAFCGHKWGYSRPDHIRQLDEWAKGHWKPKLKRAQPMINEGRIEGRRFYHNVKRTISFVQLHKTKFTKFCVSLLRERRLPAPTQDTFMFYVANRFDPHTVGIVNFKRHHGFTQGRGKSGAEHIRQKLQEVEEANAEKEVSND